MIKTFVLPLLLLLPSLAIAEYRAYQYIVRSTDEYAVATKAKAQYIVSTLNPSMYTRYNGGSFIKVDLLRTWICPGYTGNRQKICDHPYDKETPSL